jgi:two-component system, NarL family, response regulator DevR
MGATRVFVIEDHELVRDALEHFINRDPTLELSGAAGTATDGMKGVERSEPDVALLDVYLPDGNGIELCREIKSHNPAIKCVVLTGAGDEAFIEALLAGADGYIGKEEGFKELSQLIGDVAAGKRVMSGVRSNKSLVDVLRDHPPQQKVPALKTQEVKLLELIGEGLTNRQIGERLNLAEQTVKNYVSALLSKLGLERRTQAAALAVEHGFTKRRPEGRR